LFSCSLVLLFSCSLVLLFSCSPVLLFSCSLVLLFSYSLVLLFSCSLVLLFSCSPDRQFTCSPVHLFTYPPILLSSHPCIFARSHVEQCFGSSGYRAERETVPHAADVRMMAHLHLLKGVRTVLPSMSGWDISLAFGPGGIPIAYPAVFNDERHYGRTACASMVRYVATRLQSWTGQYIPKLNCRCG